LGIKIKEFKMTRLRIIFSAVFLGGILLGLTLSAEEAADGIREERRSSGIYWTADFDYDGASLRLSTPSGEVQEQSFDGRRSLEINTTGLEDGLYVFELSFRAKLSPELREAIESRGREASTTDSGYTSANDCTITQTPNAAVKIIAKEKNSKAIAFCFFDTFCFSLKCADYSLAET